MATQVSANAAARTGSEKKELIPVVRLDLKRLLSVIREETKLRMKDETLVKPIEAALVKVLTKQLSETDFVQDYDISHQTLNQMKSSIFKKYNSSLSDKPWRPTSEVSGKPSDDSNRTVILALPNSSSPGSSSVASKQNNPTVASTPIAEKTVSPVDASCRSSSPSRNDTPRETGSPSARTGPLSLTGPLTENGLSPRTDALIKSGPASKTRPSSGNGPSLKTDPLPRTSLPLRMNYDPRPSPTSHADTEAQLSWSPSVAVNITSVKPLYLPASGHGMSVTKISPVISKSTETQKPFSGLSAHSQQQALVRNPVPSQKHAMGSPAPSQQQSMGRPTAHSHNLGLARPAPYQKQAMGKPTPFQQPVIGRLTATAPQAGVGRPTQYHKPAPSQQAVIRRMTGPFYEPSQFSVSTAPPIDLQKLDEILSAALDKTNLPDDKKMSIFEATLTALTENISVEEVCARFGIPEHGVQECMAIARRGLGMLPKVDGRFIQFRRDFPVRSQGGSTLTAPAILKIPSSSSNSYRGRQEDRQGWLGQRAPPPHIYTVFDELRAFAGNPEPINEAPTPIPPFFLKELDAHVKSEMDPRVETAAVKPVKKQAVSISSKKISPTPPWDVSHGNLRKRKATLPLERPDSRMKKEREDSQEYKGQRRNGEKASRKDTQNTSLAEKTTSKQEMVSPGESRLKLVSPGESRLKFMLSLTPYQEAIRQPLKREEARRKLQLLLQSHRVESESTERAVAALLYLLGAPSTSLQEAAARCSIPVGKLLVYAKLACLSYKVEDAQGSSEKPTEGQNKKQTCRRTGRNAKQEAEGVGAGLQTDLVAQKQDQEPVQLSAILEDVRVNLLVTDLSECLELLKSSKFLAASKSLLRLLLRTHVPNPLERAKMAICMEDHILDGVSAKHLLQTNDKVKAFWEKFEKMRRVLEKDYTLYREKLDKIIEGLKACKRVTVVQPARSSDRNKNRKAAPNMLYLDAAFKGEVNDHLVQFVRRLKRNEVPLHPVVVARLARDINERLPHSQEVSLEMLRDWVTYSFMPDNDIAQDNDVLKKKA